MAFIDQVQDLTSLTVSDTDELSQFLKDGVLDVTNRWLAIRPQDIELFGRESSETTSNTSLNLNGARIISVIREDGTNNQWRNCRKISPALQYDVTDVDSLHYASKTNPAYMIGDAGKISVFPTPGSDPNAFKAYYVNKDPVNSSGSALIHSHDDILYFPIDKVYLVVMYAGMKSLQAKMGATTITDLTVTAVPPAAPSLSAITFSSLDSTIDANMNAVVDGNTYGSNTAPTYTPPVITNAQDGNFGDDTNKDLSALSGATWTALDYDFDNENMDPLKWFQVAGDLIQNQEDTELAQAQLQKISTYIQAYSTAMQNNLNTFNKENVVFQANIQESMAEFQQQNQINISNAERSQNRQLQNSINDMKALYDDNAQAIQKYGAELQLYQAKVAEQVQAYTQNLQADGTGYQWLQAQYTALKAEYDAAFMIAAPKQQQGAR